MTNFDEHALEMSIMQLFKDEGYIYVSGDQIHRERTEVLLIEDLKQYLYNRYAKDGITSGEMDSVILMLRNISGTIYEANKEVYRKICNGHTLNREDRTQKDLYIKFIDFDTHENNIFKIVNQFEIDGINNQRRIPDGIVFVNGIPLVVLEFKSAVKENTTIMDAYTQLTVRYRRDIPELFKYNAFIVISDGVNNKYGSFFSPYDFFYAWRKVENDDTELDGINSLITMVQGLFRQDRLIAVIKDFIYFPNNSDKDLKILCRYPQFFAANKHSRIFNEYREFVSVIEKQNMEVYSVAIIHIPIKEYTKIGLDITKSNESSWEKNKRMLTFLDYLLIEFLITYQSSEKVTYRDVVRKAGEKFIFDILHYKSHEINLNIHNDINILYTLKYESNDNKGNLLICNDIFEVLESIDIRFDEPISIVCYKKIRKLLEITKDEVFLIGTLKKVYGLITQETLKKVPFFIGYHIKIYGANNWSIDELKLTEKKNNPIIQCKDSFYLYPQPRFDYRDFSFALKKKFLNADIKRLIKIVNLAIKQKHGTTIVITNNAKDEARRLSYSCFKLVPTNSDNIIEYITSIDGAILLDPKGDCHGIGAILDGRISETEDISNGARHNSAKRYKNENSECIIVIISEDGYITPLY